MKNDDGRQKLYMALAIVLGIMVLVSIFFVFRKNTIDAPELEIEEQTSIIDIPGMGEKSDPLEKDEPEVDITVTPQYHGSFSWDKIGEWLEDPSELIDNTSVSIEGSVKF